MKVIANKYESLKIKVLKNGGSMGCQFYLFLWSQLSFHMAAPATVNYDRLDSGCQFEA